MCYSLGVMKPKVLGNKIKSMEEHPGFVVAFGVFGREVLNRIELNSVASACIRDRDQFWDPKLCREKHTHEYLSIGFIIFSRITQALK